MADAGRFWFRLEFIMMPFLFFPDLLFAVIEEGGRLRWISFAYILQSTETRFRWRWIVDVDKFVGKILKWGIINEGL